MAELMQWAYWYCTDFCVNLANLLEISYVELNIWLFLILFPGIIIILILLNLNRYIVAPKMKLSRNKSNYGA